MANRAFNLNATLNIQGPFNTKSVIDKLRKDFSGITANVDIKVSASAASRIAGINKELQILKANLQGIQGLQGAVSNSLNSISGTTAKTATSTQKAATAQTKLKNELKTTAKHAHEAASEMEEFGRISGLAIRRFAGFTIASTAVFALTGSISSAVKESISFQRELVRIGQATDTSLKGLRSLNDEVSRLSTNFGVSSAELLGAARILAQAGLSATETRQALEALAKTDLSPSFDSIEQTTEGVIAAMRQFNITAKDVDDALGSINEVSAKYAVESEDIIQAIRRTGGVFAAAAGDIQSGKQSLNEFVALFTSVRATTRESAESIATGLRTIFTRLQRKETLETLDAMGVELLDLEGKFVGPYKAILALNKALSTIDTRDPLFSQITEELGGFRQIGKTIPLIKQAALAQEAYQTAISGTKSLDDDARQAQEALAIQFEKTRQKFLEMVREITDTESFQNVAKGLFTIADAFIQVGNAVKPVLPLIAAFTAFQAIKATTQFTGGFLRGVKSNGGARGLGERLGGGLEQAVETQTAATRVNSQAVATAAEREAVASRTYVTALTHNARELVKLTARIGELKIFGGGTGRIRRSGGGAIHSPRSRFAGGGRVRYKAPFTKGDTERIEGSPNFIRKGPRPTGSGGNSLGTFGAVFLQSPTGNVVDIPTQTHGEVQVQNPQSGKLSNFSYNLLSGFLNQGTADSIQQGIYSSIGQTIQAQGEKIASQFGIKERAPIDSKFLKRINIDNVSGNIFEGIVSSLGSPFDSGRRNNAKFDFPGGIGALSSAFGIPGNLATEAKGIANTGNYLDINKKIANLAKSKLDAGDTVADVVRRNTNLPLGVPLNPVKLAKSLGIGVKAAGNPDEMRRIFGDKMIVRQKNKPVDPRDVGYTGGATYKRNEFILLENLKDQLKAEGGQMGESIPALTTPGELVFGPRAASQAGYSALAHYNQTGDPSGLGGFDSRDVYRVPGSGRGDSYSSDLPEGSFVIRRDSAESMSGSLNKLPRRFKNGGHVSRFADGGNVSPSGSALSKEERKLAAQMEEYRRWREQLLAQEKAAAAKARAAETGNLFAPGEKDKLEAFTAGTQARLARDSFSTIGIEPALPRTANGEAMLQNLLSQRSDAITSRFAQSEPKDLFSAPLSSLPTGKAIDPSISAAASFADKQRAAAQASFQAEVRAREKMIKAFEQYGHSTAASIKATNAYNEALNAGKGRLVAFTNGMAAAQGASKSGAGFIGPPRPPSSFLGFKFSGGSGANKRAPLTEEQRFRRQERLTGIGTTLALLSTQVQFGESAEQRAASGALTGGLTGAALGSTIGPLGTAAGAAAGALLGAADSFRSASEDIARNSLEKALDSLTQTVSDYNAGLVNSTALQLEFNKSIEATAKKREVTEGAALLNTNAITSALSTILLPGGPIAAGILTAFQSEKQRNVTAITAADSQFGGFGLTLAKSLDAVGLGTVGSEFGGITRVEDRERQSIEARATTLTEESAGVLAQFKQVVMAQIEAGKTYEQAVSAAGVTQDEVNQLFGNVNKNAQITKLRGDNSLIGAIGGRDSGKFKEEVTKIAHFNQLQKEIAEQYAESAKRVRVVGAEFGILNERLNETSQSSERFRTMLQDLSGDFSSVLLTPIANLQNINALSQGEVSNRLGQARSVIGDNPLFREAEALVQDNKKLIPLLTNIIQNTLQNPNISDKDALLKVFNTINPEKLGQSANIDSRLITDAVRAIQQDLSNRQSTEVDADELINNSEFLNKVTSDFAKMAQDLANNGISVANQAMVDYANAVNIAIQKQQQANDLQDQIVNGNFNLINRINELRGNDQTIAQARAQRLAPVLAATSRAGIGPTSNVGSIQAALQGLIAERGSLEGISDPRARADALARNTSRMADLQKALGILSQDVTELAVVEKQIADLDRQKSGRTDLAERVFGARFNPEEAFKLQRAVGVTGAAARGQLPLSPQDIEAFKDGIAIIKQVGNQRQVKNAELLEKRVFAAGAAGGDPRLRGFFEGRDLDAKKEDLLGKVTQFENQRLEALRAQHQMALQNIDKAGTTAVRIIEAAGATLPGAPRRPGPPEFATGGFIGGINKGRDSELIAAQPGEFVVNRQAALKNSALLKRINAGVQVGIPKFQNGGVVGGGSMSIGNAQIGLNAPSLSALNGFALASAQLGTALGQLSNLTTISQNLSTALQQLSNINIPTKIEIVSAPIQHNIVINGAEALSNMMPAIRTMIEEQFNANVNKMVNPITGEPKEGIGQGVRR